MLYYENKFSFLKNISRRKNIALCSSHYPAPIFLICAVLKANFRYLQKLSNNPSNLVEIIEKCFRARLRLRFRFAIKCREMKGSVNQQDDRDNFNLLSIVSN